jgi:hypothetical protein
MNLQTQTQERTNIVYILWHRPCLNGLDFLGIRTDALLIHNVAQVLHICLNEAKICFTKKKLFPFTQASYMRARTVAMHAKNFGNRRSLDGQSTVDYR